MPKLPRVSASQVIRSLERLGFVQVRQRGSHVILKKQLPDGTEVGCVVPQSRKTVAVGTLKNILNQAGVSIDEFIENL
jgi:predicted RNA binding protein YcfA (HicA-like mRNA interferase family)